MTGYVALFGDPVTGNPTSRMHNTAFESLGMDLRYLDIRVEAGRLPEAVDAARALRFAGLNLTIPHKVTVVPLLDARERSAELIGAVNTVRRDDDGRYVGSNTDGQGFVAALRASGHDPAGAVVIVLGAGGAARAVAVELALAGADRLVVVNRGADRRASVVSLILGLGVSAVGLPWDGEIDLPPCDILVHATPIGMRGKEGVPTLPPVRLDTLGPGVVVCDLNPETTESPLLLRAREQGLPTIHGLETLARQGALGFEAWTGVRPPPNLMIGALRSVGSR